MSPISPNNIHQHELIGLNVELIHTSDKQLIGRKGLIIDETKNMFIIDFETQTNSKRAKIVKKDCTFRFTLPSGEMVDVEGRIIKDKPENRLKNIIRKRW